jgi:hypothetical protein
MHTGERPEPIVLELEEPLRIVEGLFLVEGLEWCNLGRHEGSLAFSRARRKRNGRLRGRTLGVGVLPP